MKEDVANLVKQAADAAKLAPEHLQEAAFNKAFEALLAGGRGAPDRDTLPNGGGGRKAKKKNAKPAASASGHLDELEQLDRTGHPEITHNETSLNNALRLLRAAKNDLNIDGLTGATIAKMLVEKFRCRISRQAVSMALNGAGRYVDRQKDGGRVVFRIMALGEEYLDKLSTNKESAGKIARRKHTAQKNKDKEPTKKAQVKQKKTGESTKKETPGKRKTGPATAMRQLYEANYFSSARTIVDIISKLRHDLGLTFKQNELSPALLRWLRSSKLTRKQNTDNQYEYKQV